MRPLLLMAPAVLLLAGLGACGEQQNPQNPAELSPGAELPDDRTFLSSSVTEEGQARELARDTRIRLGFTDGELKAEAGCNHILGTASTDGDTLVVESTGTTEMGCEPELHEQDEWLIDFLTSRPVIAVDGDNMTLTADDTTIEFVDAETEQPELADTRWVVDTVLDGESASSTPQGVAAELIFNADGTVGGNTGCNTFGADYEIDGDRVMISDLIATKIACEGDAGQMEATVLTVLDADPTFEISGQTLTLTGDDGQGIGMRADS